MTLMRKAVGLCLVAGVLAGCTGGNGRDAADDPAYERTGARGGNAAEHGRAEARGEELAAEAFRLFKAAETVRMTTTRGALEASLLMDRAGNCTGTFDGGPMRRAEVIVIAGERVVYLRYTAKALAEVEAEAERRGAATARRVKPRIDMLRGKYLKMPDPKDAFGQQCDLQVGAQTLPFDAEGVEAGEPTTQHGERVIPLTGMGEDDDTLYVAAEGPPYMRFVELESGDELRFSDYGKPLDAKAPPARLVVEPEDLGTDGGGGDLGGGLLDA